MIRQSPITSTDMRCLGYRMELWRGLGYQVIAADGRRVARNHPTSWKAWDAATEAERPRLAIVEIARDVVLLGRRVEARKLIAEMPEEYRWHLEWDVEVMP